MADRRRRTAGVTCAVLAVMGVVAACGGGSGGSPTPSPSKASSSTSASSSAGPTSTADRNVARIGVIASERGPLVATSKTVRNSVELAVREANAAQTVPGWQFDAVPADDSSTQSGGQQAASVLAGNDRVIGVVGSTRSTIDEGMQPILNSAGIALVSPGGTSTTLTRRPTGGTTVRPYPTYFRLSATDGDQGVAAARYAKSDLHVASVAIVDDGTSYGRLLAGTFSSEAKRLGLARPVDRTLVTDPATATPAVDSRAAKVADAVAKSGAKVVFFGGTSDAAAAFALQLRIAGVTVPLMGGDALLDGRFLLDVGAIAAQDDYAVFPGAPSESLDTARTFVRRYRAAGFGADPGVYGATAYDATRAIIAAFASSVGSATSVNASVRLGVVDGLDATSFVGATGPVSFDRFGDARIRPLAVYGVLGRGWDVAGVVHVG